MTLDAVPSAVSLQAALVSTEAHAGDAKIAAFRRLAGMRGAPPPPPGSWQRWLAVLACLRRLQGDRWPSLLQARPLSCSV